MSFGGGLMRIYSGNFELFESGVAQTAFDKSIKFDFDDISMEVVFLFDKDKGRKQREFSVNEEKNGLLLKLINYEDSTPAGLVSPVHIGDLDGRKLFFNYRAYRVTSDVDSWIINYFFYYGEVVDE